MLKNDKISETGSFIEDKTSLGILLWELESLGKRMSLECTVAFHHRRMWGKKILYSERMEIWKDREREIKMDYRNKEQKKEDK